MGLSGLLHRFCLVLEEGQVEEVVEHLLELGKVVGGIDGGAGLEVEGEMIGVDVDHYISQLKWDVSELESLKTLISFC